MRTVLAALMVMVHVIPAHARGKQRPGAEPQQAADRGVEVALLLVEALARLAVHGVEPPAPLVEDFLYHLGAVSPSVGQ